MFLSRARRSLLPFLALTAIAAVLAPAPAQAAGVTVRLQPVASSSVAQGAPFRFSATIENSGDQAKLVHISLRLSPVESDVEVPFDIASVSVPAGGLSTIRGKVTTSQWFANRGTFEVSTSSAEEIDQKPLAFTVGPPAVRPPRFEDVTESAGLAAGMPSYTCGTWVGGAAWGDIDDDDDLDLYVPRRVDGSLLWINDGTGHFTNEAALRGVLNDVGVGIGAVFADHDNDGDADLFVGNHGPNRLFENDGAGFFTDVTEVAGVGGDGSSTSASWADYDEDGYIDLYVTNHTRCTTGAPELDVDELYHNNGDGTFTDVTSLLEKDFASKEDGATTGAGFQGTWFDYDNDDDLDLALANDFYGPNADVNHLWRNDGPAEDGTWSFTDVSRHSGMGIRVNAMGAGLADYDHDGDFDIAFSNIENKYLMRNNGDGTFTNVAAKARFERPEQRVGESAITWGLEFADLNLDRWEDVYVGAGSLLMWDTPQPNEVLVNGGRGKFFDLSAPSGANHAGISRGIALADYDRDGRIDVFVVNKSTSAVLFRNVTSMKRRHWLELDLIGTESNRDGCGTELTATVGSTKIKRLVSCGGTSVSGGSDTTVHFGLGSSRTIDKLVIEWPSETRQVLENVEADRLMTVQEPSNG